MEDGPHRSSLEQARLKLRATLNATSSIQEPATKMHPVYESGWYRIQEQFQEIQVSIQDMIDRWPGSLGDISSCQEAKDRWPVRHLQDSAAREFKVSAQRDTLGWQDDTFSWQEDTHNPVPSRNSEYNPWNWGLGHQSHSPPLIVTNLYLSRLPRLLSHLGFCLLYPLIIV